MKTQILTSSTSIVFSTPTLMVKELFPLLLTKSRVSADVLDSIICKILRINPRLRAGELTEKQCDAIANLINDPEGNGVPRWFLNRVKDYREGKNMQVASEFL